jgi:hypothetical protein
LLSGLLIREVIDDRKLAAWMESMASALVSAQTMAASRSGGSDVVVIRDCLAA